MPQNTFFDLTELLHPGTGRLKYYGIATVVQELAIELFSQDAATDFVAFSPGHEQFFRIAPEYDEATYAGVRLNVPHSRFFIKTRIVPERQRGVAAALSPVARQAIRAVNRRLWDQEARGTHPIAPQSGTFISAGRPKVLAQLIAHLPGSSEGLDFVPVLYDLIPLQEFFANPRQRFPASFFEDVTTVINRADRILTISEATLETLQRLSGAGVLPELPPAAVVPLAHEYRSASIPTPTTAVPEPYLLVVGPQTGRKNIEIVFDAMSELERTGRSVPQLVLAGARRPRLERFLRKPEYDRIRHRIEFKIDPDRDELADLYRNALALVLPSRIEGWGLPAGEALWMQTPVLCAAVPVLREVCGDRATYFDPDRADQLAGILEQFASGAVRRQSEPSPPSFQHGLRSWKMVANDLMDKVGDRRGQARG